MAPDSRGSWPPVRGTDTIRTAAGLLLLFPVEHQPHVVLTVRSQHVRHSGQVSMPGGVVEPGESFAAAALREAREEVAFTDDAVRVMGALTPIDIPVSGFRLHPVVASVEHRPLLTRSDSEVARILEVPLATLLDPAVVEWHDMRRGSVSVRAPGFSVQGAVIWGATAMVLAELLALVGWPGPEPSRS